jgi:hypothetical protein
MTKSHTSNRPEDWRDAESQENRSNLGRLRRMAIGVTTKLLWQLIGHKQLDGRDETPLAEVFGGLGMIARPGGRNAEAFVAFPGEGASEPCIIAIRDQQMAAALKAALTGGELGTGEIAIGAGTDGSVACLAHWKADGTVEIRTPSGEAKSLVTFETFMRHIHLETSVNTMTPIPDPVIGGGAPLAGTAVIKGE